MFTESNEVSTQKQAKKKNMGTYQNDTEANLKELPVVSAGR